MNRRILRELRNHRTSLLLAGGAGLLWAARSLVRQTRRIELADKVVLITGSSRGLGFLLARQFAHEGCRLVLCARDPEELKRAEAELHKTEVEVLALPCDVTDPKQVESLAHEAFSRFGGIDILVNNAGTIQVGPVDSMTVEDYEAAMKTMFWGVLFPTLAVLPQMMHRRAGRIVNIASIGGKVAVPHLLPYSCAKFAAVGLSEGLRAEMAQHGILVTTICPGMMRTGSYLNAFFKGEEEREFAWFSLGASLPLVSMDAERAARQIVNATRNGESERVLSTPAQLLRIFHAVFPGMTSEIMAAVNRFMLPKTKATEAEKTRGMEVHDKVSSSIFRAVTGLGRSAAERLHQYPGPSPEVEPAVKRPAA